MTMTSEARWALTDLSGEPVMFWNDDKKHRCPGCHAVTVDTERPSKLKVYQCCRCRLRFSGTPWLAWALPFAGVVCSEHRDAPEFSVDGRMVYRVHPLPSVSGVVKEVGGDGTTVLLALYDGTQAVTSIWAIEVPWDGEATE